MIIIPFFSRVPNPDRLRNLLHTHEQYRRYGYDRVVVLTTKTTSGLPVGPEYLVVDDEQLPAASKSFLIRKGLEQVSSGTPVLFVDADMLLPKKAVVRFFSELKSGQILKPHRITKFLTAEATQELCALSHEAWRPSAEHVLWSVYYNQGGAWGFLRDNSLLCEIASPTIYGWGVEDSLFSIVAYRMGYDTIHFDDEEMLHLWHPYEANPNASAEHNALQALRYIQDLEKNLFMHSSYTFLPSVGVDDLDAGAYRCDRRTLFNLIGDCYFRVLGYSYRNNRVRAGLEPFGPRPSLSFASLTDLISVHHQALCVKGETERSNAAKLDVIYRTRYPSKVPTAVDVRIDELLRPRSPGFLEKARALF